MPDACVSCTKDTTTGKTECQINSSTTPSLDKSNIKTEGTKKVSRATSHETDYQEVMGKQKYQNNQSDILKSKNDLDVQTNSKPVVQHISVSSHPNAQSNLKENKSFKNSTCTQDFAKFSGNCIMKKGSFSSSDIKKLGKVTDTQAQLECMKDDKCYGYNILENKEYVLLYKPPADLKTVSSGGTCYIQQSKRFTQTTGLCSKSKKEKPQHMGKMSYQDAKIKCGNSPLCFAFDQINNTGDKLLDTFFWSTPTTGDLKDSNSQCNVKQTPEYGDYVIPGFTRCRPPGSSKTDLDHDCKKYSADAFYVPTSKTTNGCPQGLVSYRCQGVSTPIGVWSGCHSNESCKNQPGKACSRTWDDKEARDACIRSDCQKLGFDYNGSDNTLDCGGQRVGLDGHFSGKCSQTNKFSGGFIDEVMNNTDNALKELYSKI